MVIDMRFYTGMMTTTMMRLLIMQNWSAVIDRRPFDHTKEATKEERRGDLNG